MRLDPFLPAWCVENHGVVLYTMDEYSAAIQSLTRLASPQPRALAYLAACQIEVGDEDAARSSIGRLRRIAPALTADQLLSTEYYSRDSDKRSLRGRLIAAGLD